MSELDPVGSRAQLRETLDHYLSNEDVNNLCHDLGIDHENLPRDPKSARIRELIRILERSDRLDDLFGWLQRNRPSVQVGDFGNTLARSLRRNFATLNELMHDPRVREVVDRARGQFEVARRHIRLMREYKLAHDLLQRVEMTHDMIYDFVYLSGVPLPSEQVPFRQLQGSKNVLLNLIAELCALVEASSFAASAADWVGELRQSSLDLQHAFDQKDIGLLDDTLSNIAHVFGIQIAAMNNRLIAAVDLLGLSELVSELQRVYEASMALSAPDTRIDDSMARRLEEFHLDLMVVSNKGSQLYFLRNEHDAWQRLDDELRADFALLGERTISRVSARYQRTLSVKLNALIGGHGEEWAKQLLAAASQVEAALTEKNAHDAFERFIDFRRRAFGRFVQVDSQLKTLCGELERAGGPLDAVLEKLR